MREYRRGQEQAKGKAEERLRLALESELPMEELVSRAREDLEPALGINGAARLLQGVICLGFVGMQDDGPGGVRVGGERILSQEIGRRSFVDLGGNRLRRAKGFAKATHALIGVNLDKGDVRVGLDMDGFDRGNAHVSLPPGTTERSPPLDH